MNQSVNQTAGLGAFRGAAPENADFSALCKRLFDSIEPTMQARLDASFWPIARAVEMPRVTESDPVFGAWYAEAPIGDKGTIVGLSISVLAGEIRVGIVVPHELKITRETATRISHDGTKPNIVRETPTAQIFDWVHTDGVFAPRWMLAACGVETSPRDAEVIFQAIQSRLNGIAINAWKGLVAHIYAAMPLMTESFVVVTKKKINTQELSKAVPVLIETSIKHDSIGHIIVLKTNLAYDQLASELSRLGIEAAIEAATPE